jgi:hypothetical protein
VDWLRVYPIILQFSAGAVMCAVGLWAGLSSGYLEPGTPTTRRLIAVVVAGYLGLLAYSILFTFVLPYTAEAVTP